MKNEQNKIGLVVADDNEIQNMNEFKFVKSFNNNLNVNLYRFNNKLIYVIHSRIGLVNAALATQYLIDCFKVNAIWNYGAVGSTKKCKLYEVVIPQKFYYFDASSPWYKEGQIPGEKKFYLNSLKSSKKINIASGNSFINDIKIINSLKEKINFDLIDMESCAIAQVCDKNNINFYCIKGISDVIDENNISTTKKDINISITKASKLAFKKMIELM